MLDVESFEKVHGMKAFVVAPTAIIRGLGETIGMEVINVKGATGDKNSDWIAKGQAGVDLITDDSKSIAMSLFEF